MKIKNKRKSNLNQKSLLKENQKRKIWIMEIKITMISILVMMIKIITSKIIRNLIKKRMKKMTGG